MALNFDYKAITARNEPVFCDRDGTGEKEYLSPAFDAIIWATMFLGAQPDDPKFLPRLRAWEIAGGKLLHPPKEGHEVEAIARGFINADTLTEKGYISAAEVARYRGLKTNASKLSDAAFAKNLARRIQDEATASLRLELKR